MIKLSSREAIERLFCSVELTLFGVTATRSQQAYERFRWWLNEGRHAGMTFLEKNAQFREQPALLLKGAKSVLAFGLPYFQGETLEQVLKDGVPRIAQYARFRDYHREMRTRALEVIEGLKELYPVDVFRVAIDSAPLLERSFASNTQQGFIGKNTCYIHPEKGSFYLLGEILTSAEIPFDEAARVDPYQHLPEGGCGKCDRCQVNCPTGALNTDYSIDSKLCLAYWTIEHRGTIPEKFWPWLKTYYFGCDLCQLACPYNRGKDLPMLSDSFSRIKEPSLYEIAVMDQNQYETWFGGTPLTRAKRGGLRRNALIAMTVTGDARLREAMDRGRMDAESVVLETIEQIEKSPFCPHSNTRYELPC